MPKYNFICDKCQTKVHKYVSVSVETLPCSICYQIMQRELPNTNAPTEVKELVDPYTNITWNKDHEAIMQERKRLHYVNVEIPRLVEKYSLETCLENKWLTYNDKGELIINKNWIPSSK